MRPTIVLLALLATLAAPAPGFGQSAVATDGTQVRATEGAANSPMPFAPRPVLVRLGNGPAQAVGNLGDATVQGVAVAPGGAAVVAYSGSPGFGEHVVEVTLAQPDGSFGPPQRLGTGQVRGLVMNR